jgi:hypothetical protein
MRLPRWFTTVSVTPVVLAVMLAPVAGCSSDEAAPDPVPIADAHADHHEDVAASHGADGGAPDAKKEPGDATADGA